MHDSIFYKKKYFKKKKDYLFNKENFFFFDSKVYSNFSLNFVGHLIHPTVFVFDYYSLKNVNRIYAKKPKHMSFKLFYDNQCLVLRNFI